MAIPNEPYTRKEQYLNAIATGNASGVPDTPYTREEMYLDAIAKGGGGGGGGVLVVHDVDDTLDKTWQEIHDAFLAGGVVLEFGGTLVLISAVVVNKEEYQVYNLGANNVLASIYATASADGYPEFRTDI